MIYAERKGGGGRISKERIDRRRNSFVWIIGSMDAREGGERKKRFLVEHLYARSIHLDCYYIYIYIFARKEVGRGNIPGVEEL